MKMHFRTEVKSSALLRILSVQLKIPALPEYRLLVTIHKLALNPMYFNCR